MNEVTLPPKLQPQDEVKWTIHRMEKAGSNILSGIIKNKDYQVDASGMTVVPSVKWEYTPYAMSFFLPVLNPHLFTTSALSADNACWVATPTFKLPSGISIVYDGPTTLKYWNKKDKAAREIIKTKHHHFSLYSSSSILESTFMDGLKTIFARFLPCDIVAQAEPIDLCRIDDTDKLDGPLTIIAQCIEVIFDTQITSIDPNDVMDLIVLYTAIDSNIWTRKELFNQPLFSRIAFHALGLVHEENQSTMVRFGNVRESIGHHFKWDVDENYEVYFI